MGLDWNTLVKVQ